MGCEGAKEHARCVLGLGLTHRCGHSLLVPESPSSSHSGDEEFWSGSGPVKPAAPTLAGYDKRVTSSGQVLFI